MSIDVGYTYSNMNTMSKRERREINDGVEVRQKEFREGFRTGFPVTLTTATVILLSSILPAYAENTNSSGTNPCSSTGTANPGTGTNPCHTPGIANITGNGTTSLIPVVAGVMSKNNFWLGVTCGAVVALAATVAINELIDTAPIDISEDDLEVSRNR